MRSFRAQLFLASLALVVLAGGGMAWASDSVQEIKGQWRVEAEQGDDRPSYWLVNAKHPELRQEMFLAGPIAGGKPWVSDVLAVDRGKGIYLIVYYAGQPGTSELVDVFYALIYDSRGKKLLGHYPYSRRSDRNDYSPKWVFGDNRIVINDEGAEPAVIDY